MPEKIEVGRELLGGDSCGKVEITYSDGSKEIINSPKPEAPQGLDIDGATPESEGHVFESEV